MIASRSAMVFLGVLMCGSTFAQTAQQRNAPPRRTGGESSSAMPVSSPRGGLFTCANDAKCEIICGSKTYQNVRVARLLSLGDIYTVVAYDQASKIIGSFLIGSSQVCAFDGMEFAIGS